MSVTTVKRDPDDDAVNTNKYRVLELIEQKITLKLPLKNTGGGRNYFKKADLEKATAVVQLARSALNTANQKVSGKLPWSSAVNELAALYFRTPAEGPSEEQAKTIRGVIAASQTGLMGVLSLKLMDMGGTRASVPQNSRSFLEENALQVKSSWKEHIETDDEGQPVKTIYALGIRFDRDYLHGGDYFDKEQGRKVAGPTLELRAKTLVHEATHRFANTKDHAYFKDNGQDIDTAEIKNPPANTEVKKWLDNADSYGWFCVSLVKA
jgi:hypothetical protein